jgi:hypothetical protein
MKCAFGKNCIGCSLTDHCPIYKELRILTGIGFNDNKTNELIDLVKHVLGLLNIVRGINLSNKENQEQLSEKIDNLQDKLSQLREQEEN